MRDAAGRERTEVPTIDEARAARITPSVTILDFPAGKKISLDVVRKVADVQPMTQVGSAVSIDPAARSGFPCRVGDNSTSLGLQTIAGLEACGQHVVQTAHTPSGDVKTERDLWLSTGYLMPLMQARVDPVYGHWKATVVKFEAGEPNAALFTIPKGYEVREPMPASDVYSLGEGITPPKAVYSPNPEFPEEAKAHKMAGNVRVYVQIDTNGLPRYVRVIRGLGYGFDEKAVEAVKKWKFTPGMKDGHPVAIQMYIDVNFQIF